MSVMNGNCMLCNYVTRYLRRIWLLLTTLLTSILTWSMSKPIARELTWRYVFPSFCFELTRPLISMSQPSGGLKRLVRKMSSNNQQLTELSFQESAPGCWNNKKHPRTDVLGVDFQFWYPQCGLKRLIPLA